MVKNICKNLEILRTISIDATMIDRQIGIDLMDTLKFHASTCVGMAANMIGVNKRIIAINDNGKYILMYNPTVLRQYGEVYLSKEGCLCHNGMREVTRYEKIQIEYFNDNFKKICKTFVGFTAEIIQHEMDHCNGVII